MCALPCAHIIFCAYKSWTFDRFVCTNHRDCSRSLTHQPKAIQLILLLRCRVVYFNVLRTLWHSITNFVLILRGDIVVHCSGEGCKWTSERTDWLLVYLNDYYDTRQANKHNAINLLVNCAIVSHSVDSSWHALFLFFDSKIRYCNADDDCYDDDVVDRLIFRSHARALS